MTSRSAMVSAVVAIALILLISVFAMAPTDPDRGSVNPLDGKAAPAIVATDTAGRAFRLSDYRDRWLLVNFFATWCTPCKLEHPQLVAFSQEHERAGDASVVSVAYDDTPDAIAGFFRDNGGDWPVIASGADRYSLAYGVVKLPESYLVDPNGVVVHKFVGGITRSGVDAEIAKRRRSGS